MNRTGMRCTFLCDRTAWTMMIAAAILAIVRGPLPDVAYEDAFFDYQKLTWKENAEVVMLGDSRTLVGLSPSVMASELKPRRIRNFAFAAAGYSSDYLNAAEKVWDPATDRKIAILGITPRSLRQLSLKSNQFVASSASLTSTNVWKARWLGWAKTTWAPLDRQFLNQIISGVRYDASEHRSSDGWLEPRTSHIGHAESLNYYKQARKDPISNEIVEGVLAKVREWNARGIQVFGFRPPTCAAMESLEDDFSEQAFAQAFEAAGGYWLTPSSEGLVTFDASHLDRDSAREFSARMARAISATESTLMAEMGAR